MILINFVKSALRRNTSDVYAAKSDRELERCGMNRAEIQHHAVSGLFYA